MYRKGFVLAVINNLFIYFCLILPYFLQYNFTRVESYVDWNPSFCCFAKYFIYLYKCISIQGYFHETFLILLQYIRVGTFNKAPELFTLQLVNVYE